MDSQTKDRINSQLFDENYVNQFLQRCDDVFIYMKSIRPSEVPHNMKSKFYCLSEKCDYLLSCWDIYEKQIFSENKISESLWLDNFLLKYLFEECISYKANNSTGSRDLFCSICDTTFECNSPALMMHLSGETHLSCYNIFRSQQKEKIWKNIDMYKWAFEKYIDLRPDKTLYCKLCGVCVSVGQVNLVNHLNGSKHIQKFKGIINVKLTDNEQSMGDSKSNVLLVDHSDKTDSRSNSEKSVKKPHGKTINKSKNKENSVISEGSSSSVTKFTYFDPYATKDKMPCEKKTGNTLIEANASKQASVKPSKKNESSVDYNCSEIKRIDKQFNDKNLPDVKSESSSRSRSFNNSDKKPANRKPMSVKDIESHGIFMNKVISQKSNKIKLFCQPCGYSDVSSSDDAIKDHVSSLKHQQYTELKKNLAFMNFQSHYCQYCNIEFFCCDDFIFYHDKSKQHKQMCQLSSKNKLPVVKKRSESNPPASRSDVVKPISKNIQESPEVGDSKILPKEMKLLLKSLLKGSVKSRIRENLGFFCNACGFWTRKRNKWSAHIDCDNHKQNMSFEKNHKLFNCDCCVVLICDDELFSTHQSSYVHKNLKSFVSQKSLLINKEKHMSADDSQNDQNRPNSQQKQIKKFHRSFFGFRLSGLTEKIKLDDISPAFSGFGEIEFVDFIEPNVADVCICLREDLKVADVEDFTKRGLCIQIKDVPCQIQEKSKCKLSDEIIVNFSKSRDSFFEKLCFDSTKESLSSVLTPNGTFISKPEAVEEEILKACKQVKNVKSIGSRATALLQPHSELDLFIDMGDNYFGINLSSCELLSRLNEIAKALDESHPSVFKDVKVEGNAVIAEHISTELKCKLIYGSGLLIENTEVIRLYIDADEKIKELILIIKEWVKHTHLSELVSNYAITWMVLYYLMQPVISLVNPVKVLKDDHHIEEKIILGGWDCTIRKDVQAHNLLKSNSKLTSIDELFSGFFLFYGRDVDIACVHCPLTGEMVLKTRFCELEQPKLSVINSVPFTITKGFCLQDPFELNKNLTENLQGPDLYKFRELCEEMVGVLLNDVC